MRANGEHHLHHDTFTISTLLAFGDGKCAFRLLSLSMYICVFFVCDTFIYMDMVLLEVKLVSYIIYGVNTNDIINKLKGIK